jgi:DNA-binding transcriptional MerR regulator
MPDEPLLRIGPFARASWLSVKALRSYHEMGLLVPAAVDPDTGYRSYTVAQLTDATIIRRLRELHVPLEAVRQVLDARDPDVTRKVLAEHGEALQQRLTVLQRAAVELSSAVGSPSGHTPVHRRHEPATTVLAVDGVIAGDGFEAFLARTAVLLGGAARDAGADVAGPFGASYPLLVEDEPQPATGVLPIEVPVLVPPSARAAGVRVDELPATDVAVFAHAGSYDSLDEAYRQLGAWVAAHDEPGELPIRERYLVGPADTDDATAHRTEICWPVQGRGPAGEG